MLGTGEPPDTMNRSSLHLLSVASGCASTKLLKSSLKVSLWNSEFRVLPESREHVTCNIYLSWQTPSFNLLTVSLQELTLTTHGDGETATRGLEQCDPPVVGGGVAWVLEVCSVDAGGVAAAGADCNRERSVEL